MIWDPSLTSQLQVSLIQEQTRLCTVILHVFCLLSSRMCGTESILLTPTLSWYSDQENGQLTVTMSKIQTAQILSQESKPGAESRKEGD